MGAKNVVDVCARDARGDKMARVERKNPIKRIVVKVGSALLTNEDNTLNREFLEDFVRQLIALHKKGIEITLVTSGAVAAGRGEVHLKKESKNIPYRQALSAVGQGVLMDEYRGFFHPHGIVVAQALLTDLDFQNRESFLTMRNTLNLLLSMGVIPIINENDVVTYTGFKFGGNDPLAAKVATMLGVDVMVLLTDVVGLFTDDPHKNKKAALIPLVTDISDEIKSFASTTMSKKSLGGMITKIEAADYASHSGITTVIASGREKDVLVNMASGEAFRGTVIDVGGERCGTRHVWMRSQMKKCVEIVVDSGCVRALLKGGSLLAVGVREVRGEFARGDVVGIIGPDGAAIAFGQVNYSSEDVLRVRGQKTTDMHKLLPVVFEDEIMHRDNMFVLEK